MNLASLITSRCAFGIVGGLLVVSAVYSIANESKPTAAAATEAPSQPDSNSPLTATKQQPFTNSLRMKFVPIPGTPVLLSIWETRVGDFAAFVRETGYQATEGAFSLTTNRWKQVGDTWQAPGFPQTDRHPVCGVSWNDAQAFCEWLSKKEGRKYRLPTDQEWSLAVGMPLEIGTTPKDRTAKVAAVYPWGTNMPPNINGLAGGNYAGAEASETNWPASFRVIEDYRDPYVRTSPVGMFSSNQYGFYDLGGNVWEWCEDKYDPARDHRVVRGASWVDNLPEILLSSYRHSGGPNLRNVSVGFRCVLVPEEPKVPN